MASSRGPTSPRTLLGASLLIAVVGASTSCDFFVAPNEPSNLPPTLDALDGYIATLGGGDPIARLSGIAQHLQESGQFAAVDVAAEFGSVWARTPDGVLLIVRDVPAAPASGARTNRSRPDRLCPVATTASSIEVRQVPTRTGSAMRTAGGASGLDITSDWSLRTELPGGRVHMAPCFLDLTGLWVRNTWDIISQFLQDLGYELPSGWLGVPHPDDDPRRYATVDVLSTLQNVGIFYTKTFAGAGKLAGNDELVPALMTTTPFDVPNESAYRTWLRAGLLAVMDVPVLPGARERMRRLAITPAFVRERMQFADNALIYVDAAYGDAAALRQAFIDRGASLYFSWDGTPDDELSLWTAYHLFSRLAGQIYYGVVVPQREPIDRPFDARSVFADLHRSGLGRSAIDGPDTAPQFASLNMTEGGGRLGILTPTIAYLKVDENPPGDPGYAWLHLHGIFGADPGPGRRRVAMGNALAPGAVLEDLEVLQWGPNEVVCALPTTGPARTGRDRVAAHDLERRRSNPVPVTEWFLPIRLSLHQSRGEWFEANLLIHLRFDVHGYRRYCGETPYFPLLTVDESADPERSGLAIDSYGHWSCGGEWLYPQPTPEQPDLRPNNWARVIGSGDLPYRSHRQLLSPSLRGSANVWFDPTGWPETVHPLKIRLRIALTPSPGPMLTTGWYDPDNGTYGPPGQAVGIGFPLSTGIEFDLELDESFNIKAGHAGPTETPTLITWGETAPQEYTAPSVEDPR